MDQAPTPTPPPVPPEPPIQPPTKPTKPGWHLSPWRLFLGLLIILFGLSLLAQEFGWNWIAPEAVWRLWPVFIILIGASMLFKGRMVGTIVGVIFALAIVGFFIAGSNGNWSPAAHTQTIAVDREATATAGEVTVNLGAAKIDVRGGAAGFASGSYETTTDDLRVDRRLDGTNQRLTLDQRSDRAWFFMHRRKSDLELRLSNELPVSLTIDSGAADLNLDLSGVQATAVDINAGASSVEMTMDDLVAKSRVTFDSGAASFTIRLPRGAGIRATLDGGAMSKQLPSELKKISDTVYETDGYGDAEHQIDLSIDAGASSVTVELI